MPLLGTRPDGFVYASVLSACSSVGDLEQGISIHDEVRASQFLDDPIVQTALVDFYAKCGRLEEAGMVFEAMSRDRDAFSWTALASGYAQHGQPGRAIQIFHRMDLEGVGPDAFTFSSILGASYAQNGHMVEAMEMFHRMVLEGVRPLRDTVTWNAMLGAYVQLGHSRATIGFYYRMNLEGILADSFTFSSILGACSDLRDLELGKRVHERAVSIGQANVVVKNTLLRMYARCARLDYARRVFEEMVGARDSGSWNSMISGYVQAGRPQEALELFHRMDSCKSSRKDPVSWNAMIAAYAQHGDMAEVTDLYRRMNLEGCLSGTVTFVSILIGCSRAGLLEESIYQFGSMSSDHWIPPVVEHFVCVVDLLGRAGRLDEAEELVETMPVESRLKFGAWKSLLAGCNIHRTSEEALRRIESRSRASCGNERLVLGTLWRSL
ncbi:hypothetical protein SELMODRAFT_91104 [Selaginella moellendorffii]|uniref:Pentacotripeptide-repeat region of PRORP domain-containing protein n=1 Tax=Selaginella moellendorffii TaxID=88036 RepID=D8RCQ0_SELML|nr:hypothetical protein SELMODRAFT_91104 [Selaginella moellendorffii]